MYNNYNNPYFNPFFRPLEQQYGQNQQNVPNAQQNALQMPRNVLQTVLQGKSVDSIDVVKAADIPLDGSISYFPLTDGSAIVTKQLQADGTSKTVIYKPIEEGKNEIPKYVTSDELKESIENIDLSDIDDLKDEIKDLKQEIKDLKKMKKKDE